jgi:DNA-binding MarR family transcriptional regulator
MTSSKASDKTTTGPRADDQTTSGPPADDQTTSGPPAARELRSESVVDDLWTVYASLHTLNLPTWLRLDLTMAQFKALMAVERSQGISVCELGRELGIGESAASLLVEQLVRRDYVGRTSDPADRRRVLLGATSQGQVLLRELRHGRRQVLKEWLAGLGDDDIDALSTGLRALTRALRPDAPPAACDATTESHTT